MFGMVNLLPQILFDEYCWWLPDGYFMVFAVFVHIISLDYVVTVGSVNCAHFESRSNTAIGHVLKFTFDFTA